VAFDEIASGLVSTATLELLFGVHISNSLLLARAALTGRGRSGERIDDSLNVISAAQSHAPQEALRALSRYG